MWAKIGSGQEGLCESALRNMRYECESRELPWRSGMKP